MKARLIEEVHEEYNCHLCNNGTLYPDGWTRCDKNEKPVVCISFEQGHAKLFKKVPFREDKIIKRDLAR